MQPCRLRRRRRNKPIDGYVPTSVCVLATRRTPYCLPAILIVIFLNAGTLLDGLGLVCAYTYVGVVRQGMVVVKSRTEIARTHRSCAKHREDDHPDSRARAIKKKKLGHRSCVDSQF
jgi:hypothetical protein